MPEATGPGNFSGRTAVVTGAASGIGRATAIAFAREGASVVLLDLNADGLTAVVDEVEALGAPSLAVPVDLSDPPAVQSALRSARQQYGRLDALANVAAIYPRASVVDVTEEFWDRIVNLNLRGVFFACQEAIRIMVEQGYGAIVNVASGAAFRAIDGLAVYSASKSGLVGMTRVMALECARKGVRVNTVAPGHTPSAGSDFGGRFTSEQIRQMAESLVPGRVMTPAESANAIVWLCSDAASGVNGAIINVNGGNHMPQG